MSRRLIRRHISVSLLRILGNSATSRPTWGAPRYRIQITDRSQIRRFAEKIGFCRGTVKQVRLDSDILPAMELKAAMRRTNFDTLPAATWPMLNVRGGPAQREP